MDRSKAIQLLKELKSEADESPYDLPGGYEAWQARARFVLAASLGEDDVLVQELSSISFIPRSGGFFSDLFVGHLDMRIAYKSGRRDACSVIEIAILRLEHDSDRDSSGEERESAIYDPDLWNEVKSLVIAEDWAKVASQAAIFVEDRLRRWADHPKDRNGNGLYGKGLVGSVLGEQSPWRLGSNSNEREGWRALGTGFAQAVGNVDRHHRQERDDMRRYAMGVLGLASLLLTQIRYEHADLILDQQSVP